MDDSWAFDRDARGARRVASDRCVGQSRLARALPARAVRMSRGPRALLAWAGIHAASVPMALVPATLAALGSLAPIAAAQTLDLDGVADGPVLPEANAALTMAEELKAQAADFERDAARLTAEAKAGMLARARLRTLAAYLLQVGAGRPWDESAAVVAGMRASLIATRGDALVAAACAGLSVRDGRALTPTRSAEALAAVEAIGVIRLDGVRAAAAKRGARSSIELIAALAEALDPVERLAEAVEGTPRSDCWPVLPGDGGSPRAEDARIGSISPATVGDAARALKDAPARMAAEAALAAIFRAPGDPHGATDLQLVGEVVEAMRTLDGERDIRPALIPEAAIDAVNASIARALAGIVVDDREVRDGARVRLLERTAAIGAALASVTLARRAEIGAIDRKALAHAADSLLASGGEDDPVSMVRLRLRAIRRIGAAIAFAESIRSADTATPPRDLREFARQLDRDARIALRSLPESIERAAGDLEGGDPAVVSAIERIGELATERDRLARLQRIVDQIASIRPAATKGAAQTARRIARLLLDPLKRTDAARAFAALDLQAASCMPFPFEEELKRGTDRAIALTGGEPQRLVEAAAAIRGRWADAVARGDLGGPSSRRLVETAQLLAALRDIDQLEEPVDRSKGDRLATWGPWVARRATLAPAMADLSARTKLAARALLASEGGGDDAAFARDLSELSRALPLVRFVARLERRVGPMLRTPPESMEAALAPLVTGPHPDSFLVGEWARFETMGRALLEHEGARRRGDRSLEAALGDYLASLAADLERAAFGLDPVPGVIPGFDGSVPTEDEGRDRRRR